MAGFDIAFGIAGNMTGHLEQAGEAGDFAAVDAPENGPKGMFPTWVPGAEEPLGADPFSATEVRLPQADLPVQTEPEVGVMLALEWADGEVAGARATGFAAYNDVSLRIPAAKISHKKNWGPATKGLSATVVPLETGLEAGGALDRHRLVSFLLRDGVLHDYGEDSAVRSYSYFHNRLMEWIVHRLRHQVDEGPLEDLRHWLQIAGQPRRAMVGIGATRYTEFGATTMLQPGDETLVVVYDGEVHDLAGVRASIERREDAAVVGSVLRQRVV